MNKILMRGKVQRYNVSDNTLSIKLDILDPTIQASIEYIVENIDKYLELSLKYNLKETIRDSLRKKWYQSIHNILVHNGIVPDSEKMGELDKQMRENLFPVSDTEIMEPKRMRNMSEDELKRVIELLIERYPESNL